MNCQEEGRAPDQENPAPQLARATTKRNTAHARAHHFLGDTLRVLAALTAAVLVFAAGEWVTHQVRPLTLCITAYVGIMAFALLWTWRETS